MRFSTRIILIAFCAWAAFTQSVSAQSTGKRVALIIGNSAYTTGPLLNPVNDATDMAAALKSIGFKALLGRNVNKKAMYQLIEQFGNDIHGADIALFYYSGHGVQAGGENYLIPVGADITVATDIELEAVGLGRIIGRMNEGGAGTNAIILDACRNNPFPQASRGMDRGLAVVGQKPPESIIVYATEAGDTADDGTGRNGVFTSALLQHITRDEEFTGILRDVNAEVRKQTNQKQKPAKYDNLTHVVYLTGKAPAQTSAAGQTATTGTLSLTSDPEHIKISIDDGEQVETPASVELAPGTHSFQPLTTYALGTWYVEQPKQWVSVAAGAKMSVPITPQAARANLTFRLVPEGCDIFVNDEEVGVAPLSQLSVKAGLLQIRFEQSGEPPRLMTKIAPPDADVVASWGTSSDLPVQLQRQTISLDGKTDSWAGIEPFGNVTGPGSTFMGEHRYAITNIYMCRNDKDLFWRADFAETNPLQKLPKGTKEGIGCQLSLRYDAAKGRNQFNLGATFSKKDNRTYVWSGLWIEETKKWSQLPDSPVIKSSEKMLVARIGLDKITKFCKGPVGFQMDLWNDNGTGWEYGSSLSTQMRFVDFSK